MPTADGIAVGNAVNTMAPARVIRPCTNSTMRSGRYMSVVLFCHGTATADRHVYDDEMSPDMTGGPVDFEAHREHLHAVAFRMLGSRSEADDAVQETWLRMNRGCPADVANPRGWLTTVIARI